MQLKRVLHRSKFIVSAAALLFVAHSAQSQSVPLQYQYQFYQKFNADVYSTGNNIHTALKPFLIDSALTRRYDSLMVLDADTTNRSFFYKTFISRHMAEVRRPDYTIYADILLDLTAGRDVKNNESTWLNTRGFQLGGTVGSNFSFYVNALENQAHFANYYNAYVNRIDMVSGQAYDRNFGRQRTKDWSYVTAVVSYTPAKWLNLALGQDKNFIGDGYRSMLLSDFATNYPFFRATAKIGPVQYMAMWADMQDFRVDKFDSYGNNRRKTVAMHYIDWNINNRASIGFFNAYVAPAANDNGDHRGFDVNFINPLVYSSSLGPSSQPGNSIAGFNGKYKFMNKNAVYAQLVFDKVQGNEGKFITTKGWQAGVRGADLLGVTGLNYLAEYNTAQPYTYIGAEKLSTYSAFGEPLAHPLGSNFKEAVGILNYSLGRFDLQGKLIYAKYGLDENGINYGKDINKTFNGDVIPGTTTGQGVNGSTHFAEGTVGYMINPNYNFRFEVGALYRKQQSALGNTQTTLLTIGLRSSFRNLYNDF